MTQDKFEVWMCFRDHPCFDQAVAARRSATAWLPHSWLLSLCLVVGSSLDPFSLHVTFLSLLVALRPLPPSSALRVSLALFSPPPPADPSLWGCRAGPATGDFMCYVFDEHAGRFIPW